MRDVFGRDAAFARAIVNELAERYRGLVRSLKNEKLRTSAERLANWILQADAKQGHQRNIALTFDKRTLASRLGMTAGNSVAQPGHVDEIRRERPPAAIIVIDDLPALQQFAKPNSLIDG